MKEKKKFLKSATVKKSYMFTMYRFQHTYNHMPHFMGKVDNIIYSKNVKAAASSMCLLYL